MKPGIPWSIKGVEPELREVAKSAARRSGMTLGEWLNSAINVQADDVGAPAAEIAPAKRAHARGNLISTHPIERAASRLEDIAEQLARIATRESDTAYRSPSAPREDSLDFAKVLSRVESHEKQAVEAFSAVNERLATLSRQITRTVAQPAKIEETPSYQALEKAVRNIVEHLEISDRRTRDNLKSMQERMGDMASKVSTSGNEQLLKQGPAFSQMEARLNELSKRIEQPQPAAANTGELREEITQLANRIDTVRESSEALANRAQTQAVQTAQAELRSIEGRIAGLLNEAKQSISKDHVGPAEMQRFRQEFERLNTRIDAAQQGSASGQDVSALKLAVEQLSTRVAQGPDPRPMAEFDRRIQEITQKLERTDAATRSLPQANDLEQRFAELDARLSQSLAEAAPHNTVLVAQKLAEVDERLSRTEQQLTHLETIERAISQLYDAIEQNRTQTQDASAQMASQLATVAPAPVSLGGSPEFVALENGLHAVREASHNADQRNQETLEAVHETLEQIVTKLAELETAAIGQRVAAAAAPPATTVPRQDSFAQAAQNLSSNSQTDATGPHADLLFGSRPAVNYMDTAFTPPHAFEQSQVFADPDDDFVVSALASAPVAGLSDSPHDLSDNAGLQAATDALNSDGGIGDIVAAARRLHQAGQKGANALSSAVPGKKKTKVKSLGLSIPFLALGKPAASATSNMTKPANSNDNRRKLVLAGILALAIAAVGVTRLYHPVVPVAPVAIEQPAAADTAAPADTGAPGAVGAGANQPQPAPLVDPAAKTKDTAGTGQQGDATSPAAEADPVLTGALPQAVLPPTETIAAALPSPAPATVTLDAAVGSAKLRQAAQNGDARAQFVVATHYLNGDTVTMDYARAAYWYGKAAASGLAPAQYRLATLYERGKGVSQNLAGALGWYERAASLGNVKSMHNAAVIAAGNGVGQPDYAKAYKWFSLAASYGLKDSQYNLAVLIERGLGAKQNSEEALFWYLAAAAQNDPDSKTRVDLLSKSLSAASVAAAQARFKAWTPAPAPDAANVVSAADEPTKEKAAMADPAANEIAVPTNINDTAKSLLVKLGYRTGALDGTLDLRTSNAIKLFQIKQGLKVTGQVTPELVSAMQTSAG